jgi:hypothetical protein
VPSVSRPQRLRNAAEVASELASEAPPGSDARDPDCRAGQVLAFPGEDPVTSAETVFLVLVTDDSQKDEGVLSGVYLETVCEDGEPYGQYRRAVREGDEMIVQVYDDTYEGIVDSNACALSELLSGVDWVDENEQVHTEWTELSVMTMNEWNMINNELSVWNNN